MNQCMDKKGPMVLNLHAELVQEQLSPLVVSRLLKAHGRCSFLEGFLGKLNFVFLGGILCVGCPPGRHTVIERWVLITYLLRGN